MFSVYRFTHAFFTVGDSSCLVYWSQLLIGCENTLRSPQRSSRDGLLLMQIKLLRGCPCNLGILSSFVYLATLLTYSRMQLTTFITVSAVLSVQVYVFSTMFLRRFIHHKLVHRHPSSKPAHILPQHRRAHALS